MHTVGQNRIGALARCSSWLARTLWPGSCLVCGAHGRDGRDLCPLCEAAMPWHPHACLRCALPLDQQNAAATTAHDTGSATCASCLSEPPPLVEVRAACTYGAPMDRLAPRFKFHGDLAAGRVLSALMVEAFGSLPRPDAIVPVPLHRSRLRQRGYDQALELARPLASALRIPLLDGVMSRAVATSPQSRLDAADRRYNVEDAFEVRARVDLPAHVVLVDDVMTTGATLHSAAQCLYLAGAVRVDAWVAARVP
ncbi:ComF family protein [Novilysobacter antarcticus]|uniref:ComF family protein n=1 Tax=Novilysobacter antarcticus TaxID=2862543 RepID=UPI001C997056